MPHRRMFPWGGRRAAARLTAGALATTAVATLSGLGSAPAQSAPDTSCPATYPIGELSRTQPVTGLTVSQGTTPDGFTGEVIGVLPDGISVGIDMVLVRLASSEINRVGGIWSGMSGSPVYAADGRLIGAVSYGLAFGPSPVAGVTPAADMREIIDGPAVPATGPSTRVRLPRRITTRIVASGAATTQEAAAGMTQLKLPFGIAGLGSEKRFRQVTKRLDLPDARMMRVGTSAADAPPVQATAGGNLAASIAYGDVTAAGVGTATLVCGEEVVGFGHPMTWDGATSMTLHAADALYVQEDHIFSGFKVATIGAPIGTINQDRMAGIAGQLGAVPDTVDITSTISSRLRSREGSTHVSLPSWVPEMAFSHLLANEDRVLDGLGEGSGKLGWTVHGTREDGSPFTLTRTDLYADRYDITFRTAWELYEALSRLHYNGIEEIKLGDIDAKGTLSETYRAASIDRVRWRSHGRWVPLDGVRSIQPRAGKDARFLVRLDGPNGKREIQVKVPVRKRDLGSRGFLTVFGGNGASEDDGGFYFRSHEDGDEPTFDQVLARIENAPHNDDVVTQLQLFDRRTDDVAKRATRTATGIVVNGWERVRVRIVK